MISATELRIGNYVASDHFKDRDVIVKVRLIGREQAIVEHPSGLSEPMLYQGEMRAIKLTEEILLKCGFEKSKPLGDFNNIFTFKSIWVSLDEYINIGTDWCDELSIRCFETCYLHQLQNLFFTLCGEELGIKF